MSKVSKVFSALPLGFGGQIIEVEADTSNGLPGFSIVGMANKTVEESKERIRSAIRNSIGKSSGETSLGFPNRKLVVNLAPAELRKDGTHLDMTIAVAILVRQGLKSAVDLTQCIFAGELALDGNFRAVSGIINIVETAQANGFATAFVPSENMSQASIVQDIEIVGVKNLADLVAYLLQHSAKSDVVKITTSRKKQSVIEQKLQHIDEEKLKNMTGPCLDDVLGQEMAKRALIIALAGHHNILFHGPPGSGKTMLARVAENLMPPLSPSERIDVMKLHDTVGNPEMSLSRPFRSPHHTASSVAVIGGGNHTKPGEISLAHKGILFMDELPEYPRSVLEALRQPLEDKKITISRANSKISYPADFILLATMNPCPCGYLGDTSHECKCTQNQIYAYKKRLSGPLLDRFDMIINVARVDDADLIKTQQNKMPDKTKHREASLKICGAYERQHARFGRTDKHNSSLTPDYIKNQLGLSDTVLNFLAKASQKLKLSTRGYFKVIKLARTIADLSGETDVDVRHISEALQYRQEIRTV